MRPVLKPVAARRNCGVAFSLRRLHRLGASKAETLIPLVCSLSLDALKLLSLAEHGCTANSRRFGPADKFVCADLSLAEEEAVRRCSLESRQQMAEQGIAAVQGLREFAKAGASLVNCMDGAGAVQIVEGVPLGLEVGNGERGV